MRPGLFAGAGLAESTFSLVNALRRAGGNPIYTEYASGSSNPHLYGIGT